MVPVYGSTHMARVEPMHARPRQPHEETACLESSRALLFADELCLVRFPAGWRCQLGEIKLCRSWGQGGCCPRQCHRSAPAGRAALPREPPGIQPGWSWTFTSATSSQGQGVGLRRVILYQQEPGLAIKQGNPKRREAGRKRYLLFTHQAEKAIQSAKNNCR